MYKIDTANNILRLEDSSVIPQDISNTDYQQYLKWVDNGNEPLTAEAKSDREKTLDQIQTLEKSKPISARAMREAFLVLALRAEIDLDSTPGLAALKKLNDDIIELRAQL